MARGKRCPKCGVEMDARDEEYDVFGSFVTYGCPRCGFEKRVYEEKKSSTTNILQYV